MYKLTQQSLEDPVMFTGDEGTFESHFGKHVTFASVKHSLRLDDKTSQRWRRERNLNDMEADALRKGGKSMSGKGNHMSRDCFYNKGKSKGKGKSSKAPKDGKVDFYNCGDKARTRACRELKAIQGVNGGKKIDKEPDAEVCVNSVLGNTKRPSYYVPNEGQERIKFNYDTEAATTAIPVELVWGLPLRKVGEFIVANGQDTHKPSQVADSGRVWQLTQDGKTCNRNHLHQSMKSASTSMRSSLRSLER